MEYVALAFAVVAIVAVVIAAASAAALKTTQNEVKDLKAKLAEKEAEKKALGESANVEVSKREQVIKDLKAELEQMEKDLAKDPAAVRARLGQLLSKTS